LLTVTIKNIMKCQTHQKKYKEWTPANMMDTYKKNKKKPQLNPTGNSGDQIKHMT